MTMGHSVTRQHQVSRNSPRLRSRSQPPTLEEGRCLHQGPVRLNRETRKPLLPRQAGGGGGGVPSSSCRTPAQKRGIDEEEEGTRLSQVLAMTPFQERGDSDGGSRVIAVKGHTYAVLKVIGKGGSSVVYEVYDQERNLRAIKQVDLSGVNEAEAQGYINEIKLLERLQGHHRIVTMYDYEIVKDRQILFVVMERGDTDLASVLKRISANSGQPINDVQRMFYWSEMLEAVQVSLVV